MRSSHLPRGAAHVVVVLALAGLFVVTSCSGGAREPPERVAPSPRTDALVVLDPVGSVHAGTPIRVEGYTLGEPAGEHELVLQRYSSSRHRWSTRAVQHVRSGGYQFDAQQENVPGSVRFRVVLHVGKAVATSHVVTVEVAPLPAAPPACASSPTPTSCPEPDSITQQRTVDVPSCPSLTVAFHDETRTVGWRWGAKVHQWEQSPTPWTPVPGTDEQRPAGVSDCVRIGNTVPAGAVLPDLRIKDLTRCGRGDAKATGGTCFTIVPSAPHDADFPDLDGEKLLKFPVITLNVDRGRRAAGRVEILADRTGTDSERWEAFQNFYDANGHLLGSTVDPGVRFYFAGDGHEHWHVRDFDDYELLDAAGRTVARAEKHGYCMQDNTTYDPMQGRPGVSREPAYTDSIACGKGLTDTLLIIHGLSRGWGDTYPVSLPDQAIVITGVPDGVYAVRVHADALGAVAESDEHNNVAKVLVRITGNTVSVVPGTSVGGIP